MRKRNRSEEYFNAVRDYLFSELTLKHILKKYSINRTILFTYMYDSRKMTELSKENGYSTEEIYAKLQEKRKSYSHSLTFKTNVVDNYIFSDSSSSKIGKTFGISRHSVLNWSKNKRITEELARTKGISTKELLSKLAQK